MKAQAEFVSERRKKKFDFFFPTTVQGETTSWQQPDVQEWLKLTDWEGEN